MKAPKLTVSQLRKDLGLVVVQKKTGPPNVCPVCLLGPFEGRAHKCSSCDCYIHAWCCEGEGFGGTVTCRNCIH